MTKATNANELDISSWESRKKAGTPSAGFTFEPR
jgi:hypothetical protein